MLFYLLPLLKSKVIDWSRCFTGTVAFKYSYAHIWMSSLIGFMLRTNFFGIGSFVGLDSRKPFLSRSSIISAAFGIYFFTVYLAISFCVLWIFGASFFCI